MELSAADDDWKVAPALAAGNTVVLKPSDTTPASTTLFAELCQEFLPPGVFNVVCGDHDTGRAWSNTSPADGRHHRIGARRHGGGESAASDLKKVHLELGGKAPVIVFDDADIEKAARASQRPATSTPVRTARRRPACSRRSRGARALR